MTAPYGSLGLLGVNRWIHRHETSESRCAQCPSVARSIFCNLEDAGIKKLAPALRSRRFPRGAVLFMEKDEPREVFCIRAGRVKLFSSSPDGRNVIAALAGPGSFLGARHMLLGIPHDLTAEAAEPTQLCMISREAFLELLQEAPAILLELAQQFGSELSEAYRKISGVVCRPLSERLAELLLALSQTHGQPTSAAVHIQTNLCQEELSELLGVSRRSLNRALAELRDLGLIQCRRRSILVCNTISLCDWLAQRS